MTAYPSQMSHGPTKFASKGCCIYCGAKDVPLSREHIVPLSIGGQHVIEAASCNPCADITKRFEQDVARELWGHGRISAVAPSRRKKDRPTHLTVGHPARVFVPYTEYPPQFAFYKMQPPGVLQGLSADTDILGKAEIIVICDDQKLNEFAERHKTQITLSFRHVPVSFARMIAKIGYGHILMQLDIGDFEPLILPSILDPNTNVSYLVGCKPETAPPVTDVGYKLETTVAGLADSALIIAEVRLLANCHTPTYQVVVGRTTSVENTQRVIEKLGPGEMFVR
jgi:hypothetical protein